MSKKYHNLAGWLRDVMGCLEADDDEYASELFTMLARVIVDYAPDWFDVTDAELPEADDASGGERRAPLGIPDDGDRHQVLGFPPGHDPGGAPHLDREGGVDPEVGHHRASALARSALPRPATPVGGAERVVKPDKTWEA